MTYRTQLVSDQISDSDHPMVSVAVTSYNREQSIAATLESILSQQVNFAVEIVVGDDGSKDRTLDIVRSFANRFPYVIRLLERSKNVGIQRNYFETFHECRGKYIAILDSDDVWTHSEKLQRQVDELERNSDVMVCTHYARWVTPDRKVLRERVPNMQPGRYGLEDILRDCFIRTPCVVFRQEVIGMLPDWYVDATPLTDWPVFAIAALHGDILLIDGTYAEYQLTPNSTCSAQGESFWYRMDIQFYDIIRASLPRTMQRLAKEQQAIRYERLAYFLRRKGDFAGSLAAGWSAVKRAPSDWRSWKGAIAATLNYLGVARKTA